MTNDHKKPHYKKTGAFVLSLCLGALLSSALLWAQATAGEEAPRSLPQPSSYAPLPTEGLPPVPPTHHVLAETAGIAFADADQSLDAKIARMIAVALQLRPHSPVTVQRAGSYGSYTETDLERVLEIARRNNENTRTDISRSIGDVTNGGSFSSPSLTNATIETLTVGGDTLFNNALTLAQTTVPATTADKLYNLSGDLYWAGSVIGGASTGQWTTDGTDVWRAGGKVGIGRIPSASGDLEIEATSVRGALIARSGSPWGSGIVTQSSWGTTASPSQTTSGQYLGTWEFMGYGATDFMRAAMITAVAEETFTDSTAAANLRFWTTPSGSVTSVERMRIDSAGNVGIGTTAPQANQSAARVLHIKAVTTNGSALGSQLFLDGVRSTGGTSPGVSTYFGRDGAPEWHVGLRSAVNNLFDIVETGVAVRASFATGGNIGFSIDPVSNVRLTIRGSTADSTAAGLNVRASNNASLFLVRNDGNVGIGTTSPWAKLSVAGTAAFDGLTVAGASSDALCLTGAGEMVVNTGAQDCTVSSERFKHTIQQLALDEADSIASALTPVAFRYNDTDEPRLGLRARPKSC